jgi:hypothetical protein
MKWNILFRAIFTVVSEILNHDINKLRPESLADLFSFESISAQKSQKK